MMLGENEQMQELNHGTIGAGETKSLHLNAAPECCQVPNPPTPPNHNSMAAEDLQIMFSSILNTECNSKQTR